MAERTSPVVPRAAPSKVLDSPSPFAIFYVFAFLSLCLRTARIGRQRGRDKDEDGASEAFVSRSRKRRNILVHHLKTEVYQISLGRDEYFDKLKNQRRISEFRTETFTLCENSLVSEN